MKGARKVSAALVVVALAASAGTVLWMRGHGGENPGLASPRWKPVPEFSSVYGPEVAASLTATMDQMRNQIALRRRITPADAMFLRDAGEEFTDELPRAYVRRFALATMSEQFVLGKRIDDEARDIMTASMVGSLEDPDPSIRMGALSSIGEAGLADRPDVLALAPTLVKDADDRVRAIAARMFPGNRSGGDGPAVRPGG